MQLHVLVIPLHFLLLIQKSRQHIVNYSWKKVLVEKEYLNLDTVSAINIIKNTKIQCGGTCSEIDWCRLWCFESVDTCYILDLYVSPSYKLLSGINPIECYTKSRVDLAIGATAYESSLYASDRLASHLTDGIQCKPVCNSFASDYETNAWVLINLGKSALISEVRILPLKHPIYGPYYCSNIEVRIGSSMVSNGDFSLYSFFGKQDGKCIARKFNTITPEGGPTVGQFVVVIRKTASSIFSMMGLEVGGIFTS